MSEPSSTPLIRKLGIRAGTRLTLANAPDDACALLRPLPPGVVLLTEQEDGSRDVVLPRAPFALTKQARLPAAPAGT